MKRKSKWLMGIAGTLAVASAGYTVYRFSRRPANTPTHFKPTDGLLKKVVACLGDSHTQGTMAHNFVDDLANELNEEGYEFINAGVNGDLSYNALHRIGEVIETHPDYIIILIGTNDILARLSKSNELHFELKKHLPQKPTEDWFIRNLHELIWELKQQTEAKIAILSLPLISEDEDSIAFKRAIAYSQDIYEVAKTHGVTYLPLNEWQLNYLQTKRYEAKRPVVRSPFAYFIPSFKHYVLGKSWEEISEEAGLHLTIDTVHQNKRATSMIVTLVRSFLEGDEIY